MIVYFNTNNIFTYRLHFILWGGGKYLQYYFLKKVFVLELSLK